MPRTQCEICGAFIEYTRSMTLQGLADQHKGGCSVVDHLLSDRAGP